MRPLLLLTLLSGTAFSACLPVASSRILGRDLALADPRYAALPSTAIAGFNAEPGQTRTFTAAELQRLARVNGVHVDDPVDICVEFPLRQWTKDDVATAMRRVLPADATLEVLEIQSTATPAGELEFRLDGLEPPGVWRGHVKYAGTSQAPFWARATVTVQYSIVVAATALPADVPIPATALRFEEKTGPLHHEPAASRIADVEGRAPKRAIKAGEIIPVALLADPPAVRRGEPVRVEVRSGPARLHFDAIAEAPARLGAIVELRNPVNGKTFRARLESPATATIEVKGGHPL